jgi:hypothetical protein
MRNKSHLHGNNNVGYMEQNHFTLGAKVII